jgi:hypothetical protein
MRATITRLQQVLSGCRRVDEQGLSERDDDGIDILSMAAQFPASGAA